jgi:hypothetical protein
MIPGKQNPVETGLLAKADHRPMESRLTDRFREQARSHNNLGAKKDSLLTLTSPAFAPPPLFRRFFHFRRGALPWVNYRQSEASKVIGKLPLRRAVCASHRSTTWVDFRVMRQG